MYADIGPIRPMARPREVDAPVERVVGRVVLSDLDIAETMAQLQDHVEGLTLGIPDVQIDELPMRLQRHTTSVPSHQMMLLHMIAQVVACYHQHNQSRMFSTFIFEFLGQMTNFVLDTKLFCKSLYTTIYLTFGVLLCFSDEILFK